MYSPPRFLSLALLSEVLSEFEWPTPFTVADWLPDGIEVAFADCVLLFIEGFEGQMNLEISSPSAGIEEPIGLRRVLHTLRESGNLPANEVSLINDVASAASPEKVKNGIRDLCRLVLAYLEGAVRGDQSWASCYKSASEQSGGG